MRSTNIARTKDSLHHIECPSFIYYTASSHMVLHAVEPGTLDFYRQKYHTHTTHT